MQEKQKHSYYGNGRSFLFCDHPAVDGAFLDEQSKDLSKPLYIYKWTGDNDYCQICDFDLGRLAMGGDGNFGFIIEDNFSQGETGSCLTFGNPPLCPGGSFTILSFEVYGLLPTFASIVLNSNASIHSLSASRDCATSASTASTGSMAMSSATRSFMHSQTRKTLPE